LGFLENRFGENLVIKYCTYDKRADYAVVQFGGQGYHRELKRMCSLLPSDDRVWCVPRNTWTIKNVSEWLPIFAEFIPTLHAALVPFLHQIRMFDGEEEEKEETTLRENVRYRRPDTLGVLLRGIERNRS
jgi:hypothetical protein